MSSRPPLLRSALRTASSVVSTLHNSLTFHMLRETPGPVIKKPPALLLRLPGCPLACLRIVSHPISEYVQRESATVPTLPNQALVSISLIVVGFVLRIEPLLMSKDLRSAVCIQIRATPIAITEEGNGTAFEMVFRKSFPLSRTLKSLRGSGFPPFMPTSRSKTSRSKSSLKFELGLYQLIGR